MKILIDVHGWPPELPAGAERMLQSIATWLRTRDHEIRIIATAGPRPETHEEKDAEDLYAWADLVVTHLDRTSRVVRMANRAERSRIPVVHVVHNPAQLAFHHVTPDQAALVVWNAETTRREATEAHGAWPGPEIIVHPPVWPAEYRTEHRGPAGGRVTLVNLNENKGGRLLDRIARAAPGMRFLGVRGGYARQYLSKAPNVLNVDSQDDMRRIYRETSVLIMPSASETYGRVAVEAAISGIPVIASDLPGIREAMGDGALYVPDLVPGLWVRRIRQVLNDYGAWSTRALERSREIDPEPELIRLEEELDRIVRRTHVSASAPAQRRGVDRPARSRQGDGQDAALDDGSQAVPLEGGRRARTRTGPRDDAAPRRRKAPQADAGKPSARAARD